MVRAAKDIFFQGGSRLFFLLLAIWRRVGPLVAWSGAKRSDRSDLKNDSGLHTGLGTFGPKDHMFHILSGFYHMIDHMTPKKQHITSVFLVST